MTGSEEKGSGKREAGSGKREAELAGTLRRAVRSWQDGIPLSHAWQTPSPRSAAELEPCAFFGASKAG